MNRHCFPLFALFCIPLFAQDSRDFSGRWFLQPDKSELQALPEPPEPILRVDRSGTTIHVFRVGDGNRAPEEIQTYSTDGATTRRRTAQASLNSQTKWEGDALLINTIVSTPGDNYTVADRWRLSRDRNRLTITRHIVRRSGETESTLIYEHEAKPTPPTLITHRDAFPDAAPPSAAANSSSSSSTEPVAVASTPVEQQQTFVLPQGTKLPLRMINSVSTKHSAPGDRVYLETVYPVLSHGRMIIPPGSYVIGTLDEVKQAGRVKGKSEFFLRFDTLTLPNGTTRDFRSRMSNMDSDGSGSLDRREGKVQGEGGKGHDTKTVAETTAAGASIGVLAGSAAGHLGMGAGIGAAAGALGGLASVLATRGPDAVLPKGSTVEMVLDRDLSFTAQEIAR